MYTAAILMMFSVYTGLLSAKPTVNLVKMESTHSCTSEFLVNGTDTTTIVYEISGSNISYQFMPVFGPAFYYRKNGLQSAVIWLGLIWRCRENLECPCYLLESDGSCDGTEQVDDCHCNLIRPDVYKLTYVKTADVSSSKASMYVKWPGSPILTLGRHRLPVVKAKCPEPTATLVTINSTHSCSSEFLVKGTDTTTIVYEISGNSSHYQFSPSSGPAFHFTKNGVDSEACKLLSKGGSCDGTERVDDCQCTVMRKGVYRLKYVKTADMLSSNGTVYIKWPGTRKEKTLGKHYLPVVKTACPSSTGPLSAMGSDGLLVFMVMAALRIALF